MQNARQKCQHFDVRDAFLAATTMAALMPNQNGFANAVRQQVSALPTVAMSRAAAAAAAASQPAPGIPASPKRLASATTSSAAGKQGGGGGAVRALFTEKTKGGSGAQHSTSGTTSAKSTTGTYTMASMAKTKVVTSTMPSTFAAKVSCNTCGQRF